jgi:ABC-type transport system involved in multi-copper enzyme maturation permease subunit
MKVSTAKALGWDALYQVLDNSVFRILAVLTALPILTTFLFGFREHEIVFLFGLERWTYDGVLGFLSGLTMQSPGNVADAQGTTIAALLALVFDEIVGKFGVLFCIAATAFFVPRMIEKGAADILFHKPISRFSLYLARYCSGLLFIGILSFVLVAGMDLGLLLVSGYHDPGIFFASLQLIYVFGLIYSVCMLIGIVTRSTVASILLTVLFFMFNGCVHQLWTQFERRDSSRDAILAAAVARGEDTESGPNEDEIQRATEEDHIVFRVFQATLKTLHYTLPKTTDAPIIASKLRRSIDHPFYIDRDSDLAMFVLPSGWEEAPADRIEAPFASAPLEHGFGTARLALSHRESESHFQLWRRPSITQEVTVGDRTIRRNENAARTAAGVEDELEERDDISDLDRKPLRFGENSKGEPVSGARRVSWTQNTSEGARWRVLALFRSGKEFMYTAFLDAPDASVGEELFDSLSVAMALDVGNDNTWYSKQLSLTAPLKFNLLFSIGSSVVFTALMLALGWWRLTRIEF